MWIWGRNTCVVLLPLLGHALEKQSFVLLQAEVFPTQITKAVPVLGEDHHFFDVRELFKRSIDFCRHTCIGPNPWRGKATTELDGRSAFFRDGAFLVEGQCEVRAANGSGC